MATSKIVFITGANTGIGFELARLVAQKGHLVYIGARDVERGQKAQQALVAEGLKVKFVQINVTSEQSVNAAKDAIEAAEGRLDSLVNNAGIGGSANSNVSSEVTAAAAEETMAVNYFGTVRVSNAFIPLLRKAVGTPTILNVSSELGSNATMNRRPMPLYAAPYCASKAAVNSYTIHLAAHLKESGIKINMATPGYTATKMTNGEGRPIVDGALALLPWIVLEKDGPNGKFFAADGKSEHMW